MKIPARIAEEIGSKYSKGMVIILAYDPSLDEWNTVSAGRDKLSGEMAYNLSLACDNAIGLNPSDRKHYDGGIR